MTGPARPRGRAGRLGGPLGKRGQATQQTAARQDQRNGDGLADALTGAGSGAAQVKAFRALLAGELFSFIALDPPLAGAIVAGA